MPSASPAWRWSPGSPCSTQRWPVRCSSRAISSNARSALPWCRPSCADCRIGAWPSKAARVTKFDTVHAPIAYWAARTPNETAIDDGSLRLSFEALADQVDAQANTLRGAPAPAPLWVDDTGTPGAQLVSFLGILAAGHAAAVGDPDWSPALRRQVMALLGTASTAGPARDATLPAGSFYVG